MCDLVERAKSPIDLTPAGCENEILWLEDAGVQLRGEPMFSVSHGLVGLGTACDAQARTSMGDLDGYTAIIVADRDMKWVLICQCCAP